MARRPFGVLGVVVLSLLAAACGGGGDSATTTVAEEATTTTGAGGAASGTGGRVAPPDRGRGVCGPRICGGGHPGLLRLYGGSVHLYGRCPGDGWLRGVRPGVLPDGQRPHRRNGIRWRLHRRALWGG